MSKNPTRPPEDGPDPTGTVFRLMLSLVYDPLLSYWEDEWAAFAVSCLVFTVTVLEAPRQVRTRPHLTRLMFALGCARQTSPGDTTYRCHQTG
jgi:hypothetical protein